MYIDFYLENSELLYIFFKSDDWTFNINAGQWLVENMHFGSDWNEKIWSIESACLPDSFSGSWWSLFSMASSGSKPWFSKVKNKGRIDHCRGKLGIFFFFFLICHNSSLLLFFLPMSHALEIHAKPCIQPLKSEWSVMSSPSIILKIHKQYLESNVSLKNSKRECVSNKKPFKDSFKKKKSVEFN